MEFTRETVTAALVEVGEILHAKKKVGEIAVFGGIAIILQFDVAFVTSDVDALIQTEHGEVSSAIRDVGRRHGWNSSWINENISGYLSSNFRDQTNFFGNFPNNEHVGLRVYVAKPIYLLALKLRALRTASRDLSDAIRLARHLDLHTVNDLKAVVDETFPNDPLDARKIALLGDIARALN